MDPNFVRTVVLLVQQDKSGIVGLVLNRPLKLSVAESCAEQIDAAAGIESPLHQGGPCPGPLMVLHGDPDTAGQQVLPGVRLTVEREPIELLMRQEASPARYFANYSGWGIEQLETELSEGAWLLADATMDEVFCEDAEDQWARLMTRLTLGQWIDPDRLPNDPSVN